MERSETPRTLQLMYDKCDFWELATMAGGKKSFA